MGIKKKIYTQWIKCFNRLQLKFSEILTLSNFCLDFFFYLTCFACLDHFLLCIFLAFFCVFRVFLQMYFIGKSPFNFNDIVVFPDKSESTFRESIENTTKKIKSIRQSVPFKLLPQQSDLLSMVSVYAPHRSFLFYQDMGTGKTVTVILMIEHLKPFLKEHSTKALVLAPNSMIQDTTFMKELLGKIKHKNKTKYRRWCTGNTYVTKRLRRMLNEASTETERKKLEKEIVKEKIKKYYEITTHKKWEKIVKNMPDAEVIKKFSNRILVIDEVQRAKNNTSQFYSELERVLRLANNSFLFVLSGTPMVDDPAEICQPINLCRINEGYTDMLEPKVVKEFFSSNPETRQNAAKKIAELTKGYVSRVKGENSRGCPNREDVGSVLCQNEQLNFSLKVVLSELKNEQLSRYLIEFMTEFLASNDSDPNEMWNNSRKICRGIWGESEILSQKFEDIWANSRQAIGKGVIVNYSYFIEDGIMQFERFLLSKKDYCIQFDGTGTPNKKEVVYNFSNPQTEQFKTKVTEIIGNYDNYNGKIIQWVLGTLKIGQGITICMSIQMNLIGSTWNIATAEQFIKRAIRIGTHIFPKYSDMYRKQWNDTVYVRRYCATIPKNAYATLPKSYQKRVARFIDQYKDQLSKRGFLDDTGNLLTIDEYMYRKTFEKHCKIIAMDNFMSNNAFHYADLSRPTDPTLNSRNSLSPHEIMFTPMQWIAHLFLQKPIWELEEMILQLPVDYAVTNFLKTIHRLVENEHWFRLDNDQDLPGFIQFIPPNNYWYKTKPEFDQHMTTPLPLSHFIDPNINLDDYFPMKKQPELYVPLKFKRGLFSINSELNLNLSENEYAGVLENTENNPELFQLKFCINNTESVCNDKYVSEIYQIAKQIGINNPEGQYGKNRKNLCDAIFNELVSQEKILPWATKVSPTLLRIYLTAKAYNDHNLLKAIGDLVAKLKSKQLGMFQQMYIDIIASQYPEQYKLHTDTIVKQVQQRLNRKIEKFPLYLLGVLSQLYTKRPKRFTDSIWEITKTIRLTVESTYSSDFADIKSMAYKLMLNTLKPI